MKMRSLVVGALVVVGIGGSACHRGGEQQRPRVVFVGVTVIDATGAAPQPDMVVAIAGGTIASIEKDRPGRTPAGAEVIDGRGKFLIPGLWDMHVHWYDERYLPLFIANGVTGVRQMWGMAMHDEWRQGVERGSLVGPRQIIASPIIDGPKPVFPQAVAVHDATEARAAVVDAKNGKADFIKVYVLLPREAYFAIADESRKQGIPFVGHVPFAVRAAEASDAGQRSIEHLSGILLGSSTREDELRRGLLAMPGTIDVDDAVLDAGARRSALLDTFDAAKATNLYARFARNHTWQSETLTVLRNTAYRDDPSLTSDARLRYMPRSVRAMWDPQGDPRSKSIPAADWAMRKQVYRKQLDSVGEMRRNGVQFLAGTDVLNPFCYPGFSLHDELGLLVTAGFTPLEAVQAATRNPAEFLGRLPTAGTVEKGKVADLVMLEADPLADIGNTRKIAGVMLGGRYFAKASLDRMLADVEALAAKPSIADPLLDTIEREGIAAAVSQYRRLAAQERDAYDFGEDELNVLGYRLLAMKKPSEAIEILKVNVEAYPKSWNVYDSLAEAYMGQGARALAIANYQRSLELNRANQNAAAQLAKLRQP
jgi:amidohydrolase family protein